MKYFVKKYQDEGAIERQEEKDKIKDETKKNLYVQGADMSSGIQQMFQAAQGLKDGTSGAGLAMGLGAAQTLMSGADAAINAATGHQPDMVDGLASQASQLASMAPPPWGQIASLGVQGINMISKAAGSKVGGFEGNLGVGGVQDYTMESKSFRMGQSASARSYAQKVAEQREKFANAKASVDAQQSVTDAMSSNLQNEALWQENQLSGVDSLASVVLKNGGKMGFTNILDYFVDDEVSYLQVGGSVIPSGALHKNKHHIEDAKEELKGEITHKGIPVITYNEDGSITQHAEVEENEIILGLSLTKQIEKLWKEGTDEAAIEAGELLVKEIFHNTDDNTGLLKEVKI